MEGFSFRIAGLSALERHHAVYLLPLYGNTLLQPAVDLLRPLCEHIPLLLPLLLLAAEIGLVLNFLTPLLPFLLEHLYIFVIQRHMLNSSLHLVCGDIKEN